MSPILSHRFMVYSRRNSRWFKHWKNHRPRLYSYFSFDGDDCWHWCQIENRDKVVRSTNDRASHTIGSFRTYYVYVDSKEHTTNSKFDWSIDEKWYAWCTCGTHNRIFLQWVTVPSLGWGTPRDAYIGVGIHLIEFNLGDLWIPYVGFLHQASLL